MVERNVGELSAFLMFVNGNKKQTCCNTGSNLLNLPFGHLFGDGEKKSQRICIICLLTNSWVPSAGTIYFHAE